MKKTTATETVLPTQNVEEILQESIGTFEKTLKSGIKLQEDTLNLWKDALPKLGSPEEFQAKLEAIAGEAFPAARQQMDEVIETLTRAGKQTLSLAEKTAGVYQAPSLPEAQRRLQDVTETCFAVVRENVQVALDANTKFVSSWTGLVSRFVPATK